MKSCSFPDRTLSLRTVRPSSFVLLLLLLSTINSQLSANAQGTAFTYQGRLTAGANPANGNYDMQFYLRDAPGPPDNPVGPTNTITPVTLSNGLFTVVLDFGPNFPGADRWLEIGVRTNGAAAYTTLSPRQQLTPTPYAIHASGAGTANSVAAPNSTGTITASQIAAVSIGVNQLNISGSPAPGQVVTYGGSGLAWANNAALGNWSLNGNNLSPGQFLGSTNNQPLEFRVFGQPLLRLEPNTGNNPGNVIGGSSQSVVAGTIGATIAITLVQSPPGPYQLGDTSVTLTATDNRGPSNSGVAIVTVVDTTPPVISRPPNIVTDATSPAGAVVHFPVPAASDNCTLASVTSSPASGSTLAIGDTTVFCTATDAAGNRAGCSFTVHVKGEGEQINDLIGLVTSLGLCAGIANSFITKLRGAASAPGRAGKQPACGSLHAFLNEVNAQTGKKLTAAQVGLLTAEATRICAVLGCKLVQNED